MENEDKNYVLAGNLSFYGMIVLIVSIILCNFSAGIGGFLSIGSSITCLIGFVLGIVSKNYRAMAIGGVSFLGFAMILFIGFWAISKGIVQ